MRGFTVLGSTVGARVGVLAITEEEIEGPDEERFTRIVVRHPGAVVVVPIDGDGALLVREFRAAIGTELRSASCARCKTTAMRNSAICGPLGAPSVVRNTTRTWSPSYSRKHEKTVRSSARTGMKRSSARSSFV